MDDLLSEFLTETVESLDALDVQLVTLEQDPNDTEILNNIFRMVHTVKGTCGFLGLPRLESVAHAAENILGKFRDGELPVTPDSVTLILESIDAIKSLLLVLEETEAEPAGDDTDLIGRLNKAAGMGKAAPEAVAAPTPEPKAEASAEAEIVIGSNIVSSTGNAELDALEAAFQAAPGPDEIAAQAAGSADAAEEVDGDASLYDRLGGADAVEAAVGIFYDKVMADDHLQGFFEGVDVQAQRRKMQAFMTMAFGGSENYSGRDLREAHAPMVAKGLGETHFDRVAGHLKATLEELSVDSALTDEVMTAIGGLKEVVLAGPEAASVPGKAEDAEASDGGKKESSLANQSIRVSVDLLENLMNMVSELVLTRNQLLQMVRRLDDSEFAVPLQRLNHCTTELQEGVMQTRMQPIGNAWSKLPRIIRDLSHELDKKIDLVMNGAETELDRQVLELIKDPLTHMVRNSADHGLESREDRLAAGKPETGKVTLNAFHEGGHIIIQINDDGGGLPVDKIRTKAIENGLTTESEAAGMSDAQIQQFIMKPGFSTAAAVTSVSGRGVGMDVVRSNIEKIGGTIEFKSVEGKGTRFTIKIPLTLAIVAALIVESANERFAIPQLSVVELVRASADSEHRIETINDTPVLRLRDRLLPLVRLDQVLGMEQGSLEEVVAEASAAVSDGQSDSEALTEGGEGSATKGDAIIGHVDSASEDVSFVVVTQAGAYSFGLVVDRVFDSEEIVVKPVAPILREIGVFSGNTILGDGSVIMILDPNGIAASTGAEAATEAGYDQGTEIQSASGSEEISILVFRAGSPEPKAVPLALIARLEEIDIEEIEQTETGQVVQYRGQIMPLILGDPACQFKESGRQPVLVFSDERRTMGLVVDEIVDIVDQALNVELESTREGIVGTAVIGGKATEIMDVAHYLTSAFGDWFVGSEASDMAGGGQTRVLLVDDSPFFRGMLTPVLTVAGYKVVTADSPDAALQLREEGQQFSIIISDIEMPGMDGFQFAEEVKKSGAWQNVPMVALSSRDSAADFDRGRQVGFDDYVTKYDRDTLLATLDQTLNAAAGGSA